MLEHTVFSAVLEHQRLHREGRQIRYDHGSSCGMLLASVMSATMKRAMRARSETVSVMSRVAGTPKSNRIGR